MSARRLRLASVMVLAACSLGAAPPAASGEAATATYFASIRKNPSLLLAFLSEMPKGGDLHNHLSGAIYAESYLRWAADDGLCFAVATMAIVNGTCDPSAGRPAAADLLRSGNPLFNQAIDAMSMRHWDPSLSGHDHFFATFGKFGPLNRPGEILAEVVARAAAERVSYLELMIAVDAGAAGRAGSRPAGIPICPGSATSCSPVVFAMPSSARRAPAWIRAKRGSAS
jgi:hypothetical protein